MTIVAYGYARVAPSAAGAGFTVGTAQLEGAALAATAAPAGSAALESTGDRASLAGRGTARQPAGNRAVLGGRLTARKECD